MYITLDDFLALLEAIYYEVDGRNPADLIITSMSYDTPFYDRGVLGFGAWPGTACIQDIGCFARHEINYIAQGQLSAASGESRLAGQFRVILWKGVTGPLKTPSDGTLLMWSIGYNYYHGRNGSLAPPDPVYDPSYLR
jgi:hypothetical protein